MLCPLDLSSQRIFRQQKHNGEKEEAKENIAICKTQVLLQNVATTFAHHLLYKWQKCLLCKTRSRNSTLLKGKPHLEYINLKTSCSLTMNYQSQSGWHAHVFLDASMQLPLKHKHKKMQ